MAIIHKPAVKFAMGGGLKISLGAKPVVAAPVAQAPEPQAASIDWSLVDSSLTLARFPAPRTSPIQLPVVWQPRVPSIIDHASRLAGIWRGVVLEGVTIEPEQEMAGEPSVTIMRPSAATTRVIVKNLHIHVHQAVAEEKLIEQASRIDSIEALPVDTVKVIRGKQRLVDENFPFDESQLEAVYGMIGQQYGCITGAAGTGKTTVTKKFVDELLNGVGTINLRQYWKADSTDADAAPREDTYVPSIVMCAFTGKATQATKRNFPPEWHKNIMTVHRLLAFVPEWYESDELDEHGTPKTKMRFIPTYNAQLKLPWDIIIVDECGMLGVDLWAQLWAACKPTTRIYFIGDINQLPPVHGRSIFGFGMAQWPTWELTHIHRQKGENNEIVDAAHDVLHGRWPKSGGRFVLSHLLDSESKQELGAIAASKRVRQTMVGLWRKPENDIWHYNPFRDTTIVATNGDKPESNAYPIGQIPMNESVSHLFNTESDRIRIDAGRERRDFAIGDKVMATRNDHEVGITNGMTGRIIEITSNAAWQGDSTRFGSIKRINELMAMSDEEVMREEGEDSLMDMIGEDFLNAKESAAAEREKGRGPASHIVTVRFGTEGEDQREVVFQTLSEVGSIQLAYLVTCHKMQGGEAPVVMILIHNTTRQMMNREWLYTAITRASERCILMFTRQALTTALNTQRIKGKTLAEKVASFQKLQEKDENNMFAGLGPAAKAYLPAPRALTELKQLTQG